LKHIATYLRNSLLVYGIVMLAGLHHRAAGQDIHFSQFFHSPLNLNPALTGSMEAQYRLALNQRTQWRSVTVPYNTYSVSAEKAGVLHPNAGLGVVAFNDRAGDSRLNTFQFNLSGSYSHALTSDSAHVVTGGLQVGITNRSINYGDLTFDNQHNGAFFDPSRPTGEAFARNARLYPNINLGAVWHWRIKNRKWIRAGVALHNIHKPQQSFYNDEQIRLDRRFTFHAEMEIPVNDRLSARPVMQFMQQGTYSEALPGVYAQYELLSHPLLYRAVFAGYMGRMADSGILLVGVEVDDWRFGISYDINLSRLDVASRNRGGFEFALIKVFNRRSNQIIRHRYCPDFL
jgi:type IX secretion system PorP/SprF family membrane protein